MKIKFKKQKIIIIILIVLLIISVGYIILDKYNEIKQKEQLNILQQGIQIGYEQAVFQLIQQAQTCREFPVYLNNITVNLISTECLQEK